MTKARKCNIYVNVPMLYWRAFTRPVGSPCRMLFVFANDIYHFLGKKSREKK